MPDRNFTWSNLPPALLNGLAFDLELGPGDPEEALAKAYGIPPTEGLIRDAWESLRERWLADDGAPSWP